MARQIRFLSQFRNPLLPDSRSLARLPYLHMRRCLPGTSCGPRTTGNSVCHVRSAKCRVCKKKHQPDTGAAMNTGHPQGASSPAEKCFASPLPSWLRRKLRDAFRTGRCARRPRILAHHRRKPALLHPPQDLVRRPHPPSDRRDAADPAFYGGLLCPACALIHERACGVRRLPAAQNGAHHRR